MPNYVSFSSSSEGVNLKSTSEQNTGMGGIVWIHIQFSFYFFQTWLTKITSYTTCTLHKCLLG